jgi:hypothetical protein
MSEESTKEAPAGDDASRREQDVAAFFALPRARLYSGALAVVSTCVALAFLGWLVAERGHGLIILAVAPLCWLLLLLLVRRTPVGRGFLWTFGRGWSPDVQVVVAAVFSALAFGVVLWSMAARF